MQDLQYIIGIGFTAADLPRAILIAFLFAMFAKKSTNIWLVAFYALVIDRTIWPITGMASSGADIQSIYASIAALFKTFLDDLGIYIVRYVGLVVMIKGFVWLRTSVNKFAPKKSKAAHA
ncbi:MAG: hypothetical protein HKN14_02860 [Marinicaulis sp.]|nr:hypothetical protein [Marinicaulis sp.]NNE39841.1 hypothetical protein [Marinicaulis sp.]NNL88323.1 hypothetical protein [Marinicaulis sp.]